MPIDAFDVLDLAYWLDGCTWRVLRWVIPILLVVTGVVLHRNEVGAGVPVAAVGGVWLVIQIIWSLWRGVTY